MEGASSDQRKILESIFLGIFFICRYKTKKIKYQELFKREKNVD